MESRGLERLIVKSNEYSFSIGSALGLKGLESGTISAHADGGPRSPSAHAGPFAHPPISMSGNFLAHVSAESPSNISPNPSEVISEVSEP